MKPQSAQAILQLMQRVQIQGSEVQMFTQLMNELTAEASETVVPFEQPAEPEKSQPL